MGKLYLETNEDSSIVTVTGDIESIFQNRRASRYLKDTLKHNTDGNSILIYDIEDINKTLDRIKKICEYISADMVYSGNLSEAVSNYALEEEKFRAFSEKARLIRNNECSISDFQAFIDSVSINLPNRSLFTLQLLSAYHLAFSQNACNFSVPGAGKTSVVYGAFSYLSHLNKDDVKYVDKLLIISPLSAFGPWENEYFECFGYKPDAIRLNGKVSPEEKKQYLYSPNPATITLLSYASVSGLQEELTYYLKNNKVMVVLDEAHKIKNTEGINANSILSVAPLCSSRVILTGTPAPNGYEDLYNLYKFIWPTKKIIPFEIYQLKDMSKNTDDPRVNILLDKIEPFFIRVKKSDLGIPPATEHDPIIVKMGDAQKRIYEVIEKKYMTDIVSVKDSSFQKDLVKARLIRLMQAATNPGLLAVPLKNFAEAEGFDPEIVTEDSSLINEILHYSVFETPSKYLEAKRIISDLLARGEKVVVWCIYIKNILDFSSYLLSNGINCKTLYGATPVATGIEETDEEVETREKIIKEFNSENSSFRVIVANPFAVSESISLHKACHNAIYMERSFNAAHFIQSKDRIHRYGLKPGTETNYYYLISENSIDSVIHERLKQKETRLNEIIESMPIPLFSNADLQTGDEDIKALISEYVNRTKTL